jgi:AcrR family transcriptional regulator
MKGGAMTLQQRAEETRARILRVAADCFARRGYDATGVAEICRSAEVTKGGFYYHFSSKQALFLELFDCWLEQLDEQLEAAYAGGETMPDGFMQMAALLPQVFSMTSGQVPLFLEFWSQAARDEEVWQAIIDPYRRYETMFARMIAAGVAEGTLKPVDPETTARVFVSLAVGLVLQGAIDPDNADWGEVAMRGVGMLMESIKSKE